MISFVGGVSFACEQYYRFFGTKDEKSLLLFNDAVKAASKMNKKEIERMAPDIYDDYFLYAPSQPSKLELFKDWCKTKTCFFHNQKHHQKKENHCCGHSNNG
ncbi:MAG: hypothetical protein HWD59_03865 [Coxiellaceae bacterium]|nr:MAG: hypothetical protein HWD59_03865 [Coxiellaceae bacterium]